MNAPIPRRRQTTRKSLRQSLKELLQRHRRQSSVPLGQVGSGILRRAKATFYLPEPSRVSLFPDFESRTQFDIDSYSISIPNHFSIDTDAEEDTRSSHSESQVSLLPARSLSQFHLHHSFLDQEKPYRPTQLTTVPEILVEGVSRQASIVSLSNTLRPSRSTLRIRESNQSLRSSSWSQSGTSCISTRSTSPRRSKGSSSDLRSFASSHTNVDTGESSMMTARTPSSISKGRRHSARAPPFGNPSINSIKHFGSFCVLDTHAPGCPVTATSEDLKYVFDVGEHFFLNNQECTDASMDIVTGFDADGNEVTHLVLFSPLISPCSGRSRFLLAALIDVTFFIKDAANVPELDTISEESIIDEGMVTPIFRHPESGPERSHLRTRESIQYELSCEDLLGGCYIDDEWESKGRYSSRGGGSTGTASNDDMKRGLTPTIFDDIWTDLAHEEMIRNRTSAPTSAASTRSIKSTPRSTPSLSTTSSNSSKVDVVLDGFMRELQKLYCDFFLLAKSPLDAGYYEICNVSPSVYVTKDYVHGHLSHSSQDTITRLSEQLGGDSAFDMEVRWGIAGDRMWLYCIPLFGQRDLTWICMLVDMRLGALW